jgi:hypothetical protein
MKKLRISTFIVAVMMSVFSPSLAKMTQAAPAASNTSLIGIGIGTGVAFVAPVGLNSDLFKEFMCELKRGLEPVEVTTIETVFKSLMLKQKVLIGEAAYDVNVTKWHEAWYGSVTMKTDVKYVAKYSTDLKDMHLSWNGNQNTITITLPTTVIESIEQKQFNQNVSYSRTRIFFSAQTREGFARSTREQAKSESMRLAEQQLAVVRVNGLAALQQMLEEKFQLVKPGIKVIVR